MTRGNFGGRRVVSFESRRALEMASLIERYGGVPMSAPSMREVALPEVEMASAFAREFERADFDVVVFLTGVGTRALLEAMAGVMGREELGGALARVPMVVARGPKPAAVLRELGVAGFVTIPEPNRWREIVQVLSSSGPLGGRRIAVQEYGIPNSQLHEALESRGAVVRPIPVYRWALPEDTSPLREALVAIADGTAKIALFTSRGQVEHVMIVAAEEGIAGDVKRELRKGVVASIGPVCTEALRFEGLAPDIEPEHPKMGHLVKETAERAEDVLRAKSSFTE